MGLSHSNSQSDSLLSGAGAPTSIKSFRASEPSATIVQILEFISGQPKAPKQLDDQYKMYLHKAHMSAYKFNSRSQRKQTLSRRRRIGAEYDHVAGLSKACFQALLEKAREGDCESYDRLTDQGLLDNVQADWMAAYRLAESWGHPNPNNDPELQYPWRG